MSANSVLEAIRDTVCAECLLIEGVNSADPVPVTEIIKLKDSEGQNVANIIVKRPSSYDGCTVSVDDRRVRMIERTFSAGSASVRYAVPILITFQTATDGSVFGEAQTKAWTLLERGIRRLQVFTPAKSSIPYPDTEVQVFGPLQPDSFEDLLTDANSHGLLLEVWCEYQITSLITDFQ